jgi:hypothetical protein
MFLKKKQICLLVILERNIIVKNVAAITGIFLMMDQNLQAKGIAITELVWFLLKKKNKLSNNFDIA